MARAASTLRLDKWAVLDAIGFDPHPGQLEVAESTARNRVISAGRRWGKSYVGGYELLPEAFLAYSMKDELLAAGRRREFWIVGPEYSDAEKEFRVLWNALSKLEVPFDRPGTYNDPISGSLHISLWNGAFQVHGKSAKYPDSLVGEALSGAILAEAAKLKERIWTKYIRPTLADYKGWSLMTSTPEGKNWFYRHWQMGQDPKQREWYSRRSPSWENPNVYKTPTDPRHVNRAFDLSKRPDMIHMSYEEIVDTFGLSIDSEIISLMGDMSQEAFNQEIGADFTEFVGRVFKDFDEEVHVKDLAWEPTWDTVAAVDYGFTNPNVWLLIQVSPWGDVNVLREIYQPGLTAIEFAELIAKEGLHGNVRTFFPDPASPGDTRILEEKLKVRATGGTGGELKDRLDAIREALKLSHRHLDADNPFNRPQLLIDRSCEMMIHEFNEYRYPDSKRDGQNSTKGQENPMKKDDHTPEALGRFFKAYFGTPQMTAKGTRVRKAAVRRG